MRFLLKLLFLLVLSAEAFASQEGLIYGKITLKNKKVYWGNIRWSGGQVLWSDVLTVSKQGNYNLRYLSDSQVENLSREDAVDAMDWQFMSLWKDKYPHRKSEALSRFGDINLIHVTGQGEAQIYYKNGFKIRAKTDESEADDLGKAISVFNEDGGLKIDWQNISTIRFYPTPQQLPYLNGSPLFGTVMTTKGPMTGYIIWDRVKYNDNQSLSGSQEGQRKRYRFSSIDQIERSGDGVEVALKSGEKFKLTDNRDVNASNRGIVVMHPSWGRVLIEWKAFRWARFEQQQEGLGYESYKRPKNIYTTVDTKDQKVLKGNGVFDLDEERDFELLEGNKDGMTFQIPMRYVSQIIPLNQSYSKVVLISDKVLILGHHNDVMERNWGVLVWQANSRYTYIPWKDIENIRIR